MSELVLKNSRAAVMNRLVDIIRTDKEIRVTRLAIKANLGFSTVYAYAQVINEMYDDIEYIHGTFYHTVDAGPVNPKIEDKKEPEKQAKPKTKRRQPKNR